MRRNKLYLLVTLTGTALAGAAQGQAQETAVPLYDNLG